MKAKYLKVEKFYDDPIDGPIFRASFVIGVQKFRLPSGDDSDEEGANFIADMFVKALQKFREETK